ncbi:MAG: hypothetical protein ACI4DR_06675 [Roseburia sp.]
MILLRADRELRQTFDRLIETMKVPVVWNGIFVVIDNYIILQGELRSLFFHFDSRKVMTNIIDLSIKEEDMQSVEGNIQIRNTIHMLLYVFGKWGSIEGVKVEKNYGQLNQLFGDILRELHIEPEYNQNSLNFYKDGIRITYEDVIQYALEYRETPLEEAKEEYGGLWHKLVWKKELVKFAHVETDLRERQKERLGNNFYMVGYLCPSCGQKLHMVVYPADKEFKIETEEGAVLLARAATCEKCGSFYTPRPDKLFSEGDVYTIGFGDDKKAYEDYLELIGKRGERISNHRFNRFADGRNLKKEGEAEEAGSADALEELCEDLPNRSETELARLRACMEEGFYPDEKIVRLERRIKEYSQKEGGKRQGEEREERSKQQEGRRQRGGQSEREGRTPESREFGRQRQDESRRESDREVSRYNQARTEGSFHKTKRGHEDVMLSLGSEGEQRQFERVREQRQQIQSDGEGEWRQSIQSDRGERTTDAPKSEEGAELHSGKEAYSNELCEKYEAKLKVCERLSERQLGELREQLRREKAIPPESRQRYLDRVEAQQRKLRMEKLTKKAKLCEDKPYAVIKRVYEEVLEEDLPMTEKQSLLEQLKGQLLRQAEQEVHQLMEKMPPKLDRAGYQRFEQRLRSYQEVDLSPYEEKLRHSRELAERQELEQLVKRARKTTREDLKELSKRLEEGDFLPELLVPYQQKIEEKIRTIDAEEIARICPNPREMSFEAGMEAYQKIQEGDFLPELKVDALKMLAMRLSKIKTDECELLVQKLKEEFAGAGIVQNDRHHFYPARRVLLEQASLEETQVIDFAMASYAAGKGPFEYPIFVVDSTRNGSGKEGMILTPEHLYYSTLFRAYGMPIASVAKITAVTGLLNRGIYVYQKNGNKTKIPYTVENAKLTEYAAVLDGFVRYLQEKPDSRRVDYLAREKHTTICCFRCGYVYEGNAPCPKCGYKNNE